MAKAKRKRPTAAQRRERHEREQRMAEYWEAWRDRQQAALMKLVAARYPHRPEEA